MTAVAALALSPHCSWGGAHVLIDINNEAVENATVLMAEKDLEKLDVMVRSHVGCNAARALS